MRVWLVNPFDHLPGEGFRPGRYEMLAKALIAAGHTVVWWTADWDHARKCPRVSDAARLPADLTVKALPTLPYFRNVSLRRVRSHRRLASTWLKSARAATERPDAVVVSLPPIALGLSVLRLRREWGFKLVLDVQDAWPETFYRLLPRGLRWLGPWLFHPLVRDVVCLCRGADLVTVVCDRYAELARRRGAGRCRRFRLGMEFAEVPPRSPRVEGRLRVAYLGALGKGYDLATVRRAVEAIPGAELKIAGPATPRREGVTEWLGYLDAAESRRLLAESDVGVIPMSADSLVGLPNKLADYAAADLPMASSLDGECRELLERTRTGVFYRPGSVRSLTAALTAAAKLSGDFAALRRELDAAAIYPEMAREIAAAAGAAQ